MVRIAILITATLIAMAPLSAEAGRERNQRQSLDPRINAKVQNFKAQAWRESAGQQAKGKTGPQAGCGSQSIGVVQTPRNGTAPREVNTIVTGDVINVVGPNGCR